MYGILIKTENKVQNRKVFWLVAQYPNVQIDQKSCKVRITGISDKYVYHHQSRIRTLLKEHNHVVQLRIIW